MVAVLILGACSKQEEAGSVGKGTKEVVVQKEPKENQNKLVYEVNGKKKTVAAETKSDFIKEFKVPEGFKYISDEDVFYIIGVGELFGVNTCVNTKGIVESHKENMYERSMSTDDAKNIKKIDDEFFQSHYDFYYEADYKNGGHLYTLAKKVDNTV